MLYVRILLSLIKKATLMVTTQLDSQPFMIYLPYANYQLNGILQKTAGAIGMILFSLCVHQ